MLTADPDIVLTAARADGEVGRGPPAPEDRGHHGQERALPQDVHRVRQELRHGHEHHQHALHKELQVRRHS